jgi:hypothetical protein
MILGASIALGVSIALGSVDCLVLLKALLLYIFWVVWS